MCFGGFVIRCHNHWIRLIWFICLLFETRPHRNFLHHCRRTHITNQQEGVRGIFYTDLSFFSSSACKQFKNVPRPKGRGDLQQPFPLFWSPNVPKGPPFSCNLWRPLLADWPLNFSNGVIGSNVQLVGKCAQKLSWAKFGHSRGSTKLWKF